MKKDILKKNILILLSLSAVVFGGGIVAFSTLFFFVGLIISGFMFANSDSSLVETLLFTACCIPSFILGFVPFYFGYKKLESLE